MTKRIYITPELRRGRSPMIRRLEQRDWTNAAWIVVLATGAGALFAAIGWVLR